MSASVDAQCFLRLKPDRRARSRPVPPTAECGSDTIDLDRQSADVHDSTERNRSGSGVRGLQAT